MIEQTNMSRLFAHLIKVEQLVEAYITYCFGTCITNKYRRGGNDHLCESVREHVDPNDANIITFEFRDLRCHVGARRLTYEWIADLISEWYNHFIYTQFSYNGFQLILMHVLPKCTITLPKESLLLLESTISNFVERNLRILVKRATFTVGEVVGHGSNYT